MNDQIFESIGKLAAGGGWGGVFNPAITSPLALGALAGPSLYHMATGKDPSDDVKDVAEVGGLGMLIHGELPAMMGALGRRRV